MLKLDSNYSKVNYQETRNSNQDIWYFYSDSAQQKLVTYNKIVINAPSLPDSYKITWVKHY